MLMPKYTKIEGGYSFETLLDFTDPQNGYIINNDRDYTIKKIDRLLNSEDTKRWVEIGNALIMYGHMARDIKNSQYLPREHHPDTGLEQEPLGRITSIARVSDKHILIKAILIETPTNKVKSVVNLTRGGIGGFSMAWNFESYVLFGMDFVLIPAYNSNRVIKAMCENGGCLLDNALNVESSYINDYKDLLKKEDDYATLQHIQTLDSALDVKNEEIERLKTKIERLKTESTTLDSLFSVVTINEKVETPTVIDKRETRGVNKWVKR